jgi:hypothetical protein
VVLVCPDWPRPEQKPIVAVFGVEAGGMKLKPSVVASRTNWRSAF